MSEADPACRPIAENVFRSLLDRLLLGTSVTAADRDAVAALFGEPRRYRARATIADETRDGGQMHLLLDGWACRHQLLSDGRRQIVALLLPGDMCDPATFFGDRRCFALATLTACRVASIEIAALRALATERPAIARAFGWLLATDNAALAERVTCLGRRSARGRLAHLLCDLSRRLQAAGGAASGFDLPITQEELADTLGLTAVHVNRVLHRLCADGLVAWRDRRVTIPDEGALRREAEFRPRHLPFPADAWPAPGPPAAATVRTER